MLLGYVKYCDVCTELIWYGSGKITGNVWFYMRSELWSPL